MKGMSWARWSRFLLLPMLLLALLLFAGNSNASVTLAWDAPDNTANIEGYKLHYGYESGKYTESIDVGELLRYKVLGLAWGEIYYFAVSSYGTCDGKYCESEYSNEVKWSYAPESASNAHLSWREVEQVTQYIYDIAGKALAHNPIGNGWTKRDGYDLTYSQIVSVANPISDRAWGIERYQYPGNTDLIYLFDDVPTNVEDIEILMLTNRNGTVDTNILKAMGRISPSGTTTGYTGGQRHTTGYPEDIIMRRMDALNNRTVLTNNITSGIDTNGDKWVWTLLQITGTTIRLKIWEDGTPKPESWSLSATDANYASGGAGIWSRSATNPRVYLAWYSVGTNGDPAPEPLAVSLDQESFRFRNDDGSEVNATYKALQDVSVGLSAGDKVRIRFLIDGIGDPAAQQFKLLSRYKSVGGTFTPWQKVEE